ncbi:hypothetical protein ABZX98_12790 [Streptomyces sp. NPDC002992]|uniref:hypothetical protein n=1 Tax=Streptomyces sp. NPDC002992 TaxID=3154273 RepID=UPI0033A181A7
MSAHDVPAGSLYVAFAVTGAMAWLAGGRRRGVYAISGGLAAVQTALHLIFSAGGAHAGGAVPTAPVDHAATAHTAMTDHAAMAHTTIGTAGGHTSLGMVAAHLLAALICGLWLARGEAALFALARTVAALAFTPLRLLLGVVPVPELPHAVRPLAPTRRLHGVVLAHTLSRRGPPRLSVPRATALGAHV